MREYEYEFKTLIDKSLFDKMVEELIPTESFSQRNIYFDDIKETLHQKQMAFRIRIKDTCKKITLKHHLKTRNLEVSDYLTDDQCEALISSKKLESKAILDYLTENDVHVSSFDKSVSFMTNRLVYEFNSHTLFLDKTVYEDGSEDYEIEVESFNIEDCEKIFRGYLVVYGIKNVVSKFKIQRAKEKAG